MAEARRMGKSELFSHFADRFEVKRTQAREFFDALTELAEKELKRSGEFVLPGMVKLVVQKRKARMGRNPATGETVRSFDALSENDVAARLERAARAFQQWRVTPVGERAAIVARAGEILEQDKDRYGRLMTLEMGKPLKAAVEEAAKCALACRYYAEHASAFVAPKHIDGDEVHYQPLGAVLAVWCASNVRKAA